MKTKKAVMAILVIGMLTAGSLTGCQSEGNSHVNSGNRNTAEISGKNGDNSEVETFTVYTHYDETSKKIMDYAINKVKDKHPNVEIEIETLINDDGQTLKTRAATGSLPDIMAINVGDITALSNSGALLQLDDYIKETGYYDKLHPYVIDGGLYYADGHAYAFPRDGAHAIVIYYNQELFDKYGIKVPENYDDLLEATRKFKENDIIPCSLFGSESFIIGAVYDAFAMKYNPEGIKALETGHAHASDGGYRKAAEKMADLIDTGFFQSGAVNTDYESGFALFAEGRAAMWVNGTWDIGNVVSALGENASYFTSYPTSDTGKEQSNAEAFAGGMDLTGFGISSGVKNQELAADVAAILAEGYCEGQYIYNQNVNSPIILSDDLVAEKEVPELALKLSTDMQDMVFQSTYTHTMTNTSFAVPFSEALQELLTGQPAREFINTVDYLIETTVK